MKKNSESIVSNPLTKLCFTIKKLILEKNYENCEDIICTAMKEFPHSAEPHNLLGIFLEKTGEHLLAMKHFRAAIALDPTYRPAHYNLETYGSFFSQGSCAFDESDIPANKTANY